MGSSPWGHKESDTTERLTLFFHCTDHYSKTGAQNGEGFWKDLETSLNNLKTEHVDIYQFHNPSFVPMPGDGTGLYEAMLEAKKQGKVRFIGITNHRIALAEQAVDSGLYDTLQFPFSSCLQSFPASGSFPVSQLFWYRSPTHSAPTPWE